jgi:RimJ/RimL family protein N-acetyltransferase
MAELGPVAWPPAPIRTERLVLRESGARDRAALIDLFSAPEVGTYIGGPQPRAELERTVPDIPGLVRRALPGEPVVLCTQTANNRAMRLAAKLGFTEVERFEEYGAEQWFGVWSPVTPPG